MGRWRNPLRRLEEFSGKRNIEIEQKDGTVLTFPEETRAEAYIHEGKRARQYYRGEDVDPPHPFTVAQQNAANPDSYAVNRLDVTNMIPPEKKPEG